MKKKIVILSAFLSPFRSGAEACAEEVPAQLKDEFDFVIITARMRKDLLKEDRLPSGIPVVRVGFGSTFDKWLYPFLAPFKAIKCKPDAVHAILETFAGLALVLCALTVYRAKRILTLQTTNRSFLKSIVISTADCVTAISSVLINKGFKYRWDLIKLIPNGIPYTEIRAACEKYEKVPNRALFVGRLEKMKGVDALLRVFEKLLRKEGVELHVVGKGSQNHVLRQLAKELGITDKVQFLGYLRGEDLLKEYAQAEVFYGLSKSEALGNVFIEAMAAGCVPIALNVGGISDHVKDERTGYLITPPHSIDELTESIRTIGKKLHVPTVREKIAAEGIKEAAKNDWSRIAQQYKSVYDTFLSRTN